MRAFAAGMRLQVRMIRADPDYLMPLATIPLFAIAFLAIVREAGRDDLTAYALLAPVLIALWSLSLLVSGEIVETDRWAGTLEPAVASPSSFPVVVLGRVAGVTAVSLLAFAEVWLVARLLFATSFELHHPLVFAATLAATVAATAATALLMAALFVLARSARTFQNSLSYPFYVLGGVIVPVAFLPDWLEPLSRAVFLSWSADLLRDSLTPGPVENAAKRLAAVLLLGGVGFLAGRLALERILRRVRAAGALGEV
ncbi:MAG TPA: ABC transporter permease [Gaiellaceae bacterium]|nr:ABC transporter permease [Gaiellaceae bacterium]